MKLFNRPLYIQVLFTILAFTAMVSLSYLFIRDTVHSNLVRNAESVFSFSRTQLEADLFEPRMLISGFSQTVRNMTLRGDSAESILNYIEDITEYIHSSGFRMLGSIVMFGYMETLKDEPILLSSYGEMPDNYFPEQRPWFAAAVERNGSTAETMPYENFLDGRTIITFARCIFDENDNRIGIIGMNVNTDNIGKSLVEIQDQGFYGIILSQDLKIIAHAEPLYIGRQIGDEDIPISVFYDDLHAGRDIVERPLTNWKGERTIAFFRRLENGWYLGLLTPEVPFYQSLKSMASTLIFLGAIFAAALVIILIRIDAARSKSDKESRHKSQFLANMSHEIRTPMNAIIGMTAIGKSSADTNRKDHCFTKIEDAGNHLLGVINDILDMSKIEANRFDLSPSEFNFEKMLQRVVNVINFRVDEKQQKFTIHIDKNIPRVLIGDDQRLSQVITNLLSNSIKFTPENGSINLAASFLEKKDKTCTLQISVRDTGIGMTIEQQKRIFNSFEQAETSTTRKYGGTGLGLAISKSIVELMGGKIWMISEIGRGTTFLFTVKLECGSGEHQGLLSPDVNLNNIRIMVVDDDQDILDYFTEISREFNVTCDVARSGKKAIELAEQNGHYHIYFIDWKMPGMDGISLTSELKERLGSVKSVVVMITAAEWMSVEREARDAGVDKFLSKPLFPSCIANVITEALGIDHDSIKTAHAEQDINGLYAGRRILLAEDVEINREILVTLLAPTQIEIDCAENGRQALQMFQEEPDRYDMIFMDVQMPEMDGYEATRRIRALDIPQAKTIRIVAMTANVFRDDIERCLEAGMDNHLGKPLDFNDIIDKINIYLPKKN